MRQAHGTSTLLLPWATWEKHTPAPHRAATVLGNIHPKLWPQASTSNIFGYTGIPQDCILETSKPNMLPSTLQLLVWHAAMKL